MLPQITERGLIYSLCFYHPAIKGGNRKSPIYSWFSHSNLHFLWISMHPFLSTGSVFFLFGIGCHIHRSHQDPLMILHLSWPSALRRRSWPLAALPWPWVSRNWGMFAKKRSSVKTYVFFFNMWLSVFIERLLHWNVRRSGTLKSELQHTHPDDRVLEWFN